MFSPTEFYSTEINKLPYQWQKGKQDTEEHTSDWNQFFLRLFMNKLYFIEMEIFYD